jgi:NIPSNAP
MKTPAQAELGRGTLESRKPEDSLERRDFVASAIAMAGAALSVGDGLAMASSSREFYQLRKYALRTGPQLALAQDYFEHALIPALNRMAMAPVGAFKLDIGPETPTYYLLVPSSSVDVLVTLDLRLADDAEFMKASVAFWGAPASAPAFVRVESWLMSAFAGWPKIVAPKGDKKIFQLRTYESASYAGHVLKVQMFNEAEIAIFTKTGLAPVFFGDTLIGSRMPSLTYMLTFADVPDLNAKWNVFVNDPAWKELLHRPQYADAEIVSNISNLYLSPLSCSQI